MNSSPRQVECIIPVLPVRDLARSIRFYTQTLGFQLDWGGAAGDTICSVSRDGCRIMLAQDFGAALPAWVWIGLENALLFDEFAKRGATVKQPPRNFSWAYEMKLEDPDGNILWLGTEPRSDLPLEDRRAN